MPPGVREMLGLGGAGNPGVGDPHTRWVLLPARPWLRSPRTLLPARVESSRGCRSLGTPQAPTVALVQASSGFTSPPKSQTCPLAALLQWDQGSRDVHSCPNMCGGISLPMAPGWLQDPTLPRADVLGHLQTRWHFGDSQI